MKKLKLSLCLLLSFSTVYSFEWPLKNCTSSSFKSYFGQNTGTLPSTSLIFKNPEEVTATEQGRVLIILNEEKNDTDFFPSTLGNAVILSHQDNIISVYGNLNGDVLKTDFETKTSYEKQEVIGNTGNSGWQSGMSDLEFQMIDTKAKKAINPRLLLQRNVDEIPLTLNGVYLQNKAGNTFELSQTKVFPSGIYKIYCKRNPVAVPFKTTLYVNGVITDQLSFDTVTEEGGRIYINGKRKYGIAEIYPDADSLFVGETVLTQGKSTLGINLTDINGVPKQLNYNISAY